MNCVICGSAINNINAKKYCSKDCAKIATHQGYKELNPGSEDRNKRYSSSTGAAHELIVCSKLMKLGYHVFRSQAPSCPCDLIAMKDGILIMVEVTTGNWTKNGYNYPPHKNGVFDWMAVVFHNDTVIWRDEHGEFDLEAK